MAVRRLIVEELNALSLHLDYVAEQTTGPGNEVLKEPTHFLPTDEWPRLKGLLAETLRENVWSSLPPLYHNIEQLKARFRARPNDPLSDRDRLRIAEMAEQAAVGAKLLAAVGDPHRVFIVTDAEGHPLASSRGASLIGVER